MLDTRVAFNSNSEQPLTTMTWGPKFLASNFYQLSPVEVISNLLVSSFGSYISSIYDFYNHFESFIEFNRVTSDMHLTCDTNELSV